MKADRSLREEPTAEPGAVRHRTGVSHGRRRLDLLRLVPPLKWLVSQRWFQWAVVLPNLLLFLLFLLAGVFGSPVGNRNIVVVFV